MSDSLDELIPVMRDLVPLVLNDLARRGDDAYLAYTGRVYTEWQQTVVDGATSAATFEESFHSIRSALNPPGVGGLIKSCAADIYLVRSRTLTGRPSAYDWERKDYHVIGAAFERYGCTWGGRFRNRFDGPHGQAPTTGKPTPAVLAMNEKELDAWCREEIDKRRAELGLGPLRLMRWN